LSAPTRDPKDLALIGAARWIYDKGGEGATVAGLGDAQAINAAWEARDLGGFRSCLWERCKEALEARRGVA
jgi:hypothetical protein